MGYANATTADLFLIHGSFGLNICLILVALVGIVGNGTTVYIFLLRPVSSINLLLVGLAISDAAMLLFGTVTFFPHGYYTYQQALGLNQTNPGLLGCLAYTTKLFYPLGMMAQTASIWVLVLITCERFLAVCYPFTARHVCTIPNARYGLLGVAFGSMAYNLIRFWEYSLSWDKDNDLYTLRAGLRVNERYQRVYTLWMYFIFMFSVPFFCLLSLNTRIIFEIRRAKITREKMSRKRRRRESEDSRTTVMMLVITLVFLITNSLPFALAFLELRITDKQIVYEVWYTFLTALSNLLVEVNSCVNFLIYCRFNRKYRLELETLFLKGIGWYVCRLKRYRQLSITPKMTDSVSETCYNATPEYYKSPAFRARILWRKSSCIQPPRGMSVSYRRNTTESDGEAFGPALIRRTETISVPYPSNSGSSDNKKNGFAMKDLYSKEESVVLIHDVHGNDPLLRDET